MSTFREPELGEIVLYRSRTGVDVAAIISGMPPKDADGVQRNVFLTLFPPPGAGKDVIDHAWGCRFDPDATAGTWRHRPVR